MTGYDEDNHPLLLEYFEAKRSLQRADELETPDLILTAMFDMLKYTRAVERRLRDVMDHNKLGDGS